MATRDLLRQWSQCLSALILFITADCATNKVQATSHNPSSPIAVSCFALQRQWEAGTLGAPMTQPLQQSMERIQQALYLTTAAVFAGAALAAASIRHAP